MQRKDITTDYQTRLASMGNQTGYLRHRSRYMGNSRLTIAELRILYQHLRP